MINNQLTTEELKEIRAISAEGHWPIVWTKKKALAYFREKITPLVVMQIADELQERRKADSEPVAEVYQPQNAGICAPLGPSIRMLCPLEPGTKLYRHAQQAPASEPVYQYWCYTTVENSEGDPEEFWFWKDCEKDFYDRWKNAKRTLYKTPQPALVVPPEQHWEELCRQHPDMSIGDAVIRAAWWNHCRAAMLSGGNDE
ncbi:hypothetical protein J8995_29640 [Klebsiella quasipneumoniae subsp. quasipneumoniae]|uniref:hypothetical protein n=1 Tax=Klebsiella quasipneumoniae TaxID=1463165 RepID=UPI002F965D5C